MLVVVVGEMGSVWGIGMGTGPLALGEQYGNIRMSVSGEQNGSRLGELVCNKGM